MKYHDISPIISEETAVFPGDQKYSRTESMSFNNSDHITLSSITTTLHIGAHTDAPNHYDKDGESMAERSLDYYLGDCQIIDCTGVKIINLEHIDIKKIMTKRILFKTNSFLNTEQWSNSFSAISFEVIQALASAGVILIGIDTPSIDPATSKELLAHKMIYKNNMAILEGVVLDKIPDNFSKKIYTLVALPLKLKNADASPVRAILVEK